VERLVEQPLERSPVTQGQGLLSEPTAGAVRGRRQQKKANKQAEQQAQQQGQAQQQQRLDTFRKAFSACIDSKGYSVK
jgi:hypothetical protein